MKYSKKDTDNAIEILEQFRNQPVSVRVNHVARSGMSRRIEYYSVASGSNTITRIGYYIAIINETPYSVDKGGLNVQGCGMDMVFSELSNFNVHMASLEGNYKSGSYNKYFFDANRIGSM